MNTFESNMIDIYKEKGRSWIDQLPKQVEELANLWKLSRLQPYKNLTYNYVLSGFQHDQPIVLKLSLDAKSLEREVRALEVFEDYGSVKVLTHTDNAVLLQRAISGRSLKSLRHETSQKPIAIACQVVKKLHSAPFSKKVSFPNIEDWLAIVDGNWELPRSLLQTARKLKDQLLPALSNPVLLHGDLHQDNILQNGNEWLVIDPKGVIGYPINELCACVEKPYEDLRYLSQYLDMNFDDTAKWYYIHVVMAACWQLEDGVDPSSFIHLAEDIYPLISKL